MARQHGIMDRLGSHLGAWMLLLGGAGLLAMLVLTPDWLELRRLESERVSLDQHLQALNRRLQRHEQIYQALAKGDPVALEHAAYDLFHLKRTGQDLLLDGTLDQLRESWLAMSLEDPPEQPPLRLAPAPRSMMVQLATGAYRLPLLVLGLLCLAGGVMAPTYRQGRSPRGDDATPARLPGPDETH